tara:strand:- start:15895 stop:16809 length:915 start_codon:yes stop_codon:yes gene_type:complete
MDPDYPGAQGKPKTEVSNTELKQQLKEQYQEKKQVEKTSTKVDPVNFPTEIIELPSKGLVYTKDNPLSSGLIEMKYMTAREEDILTTQSYIKQGIVLDKLFQELIISNGEGLAINYNDLVVGDKNAIMVAARVLGYGKDYTIEIIDPTDDAGKKQEQTFDISNLPDKEIADIIHENPHVGEYPFTLPKAGKKIKVQLITHGEEKKLERKVAGIKKRSKGQDATNRMLSTRLKTLIVEVDGERNVPYINKFVDEMLLAQDARAVRTFIGDIMPDVDMSFKFISDETGEEREMEIPIGITFFWPDA